MNKFTKVFCALSAVAVAGASLMACASGFNVKDPKSFKDKTGVIGVFRQPAFYCSEASPQYMQLGTANVEVKPTWSEEQDNIFFAELKPGQATLYSYAYSCGENESKFVLDTAADSKNPGPIGIIVPEDGLCRVVISFLQGDRLFSHNDALLREQFEKNKVALNWNNIPFCEVVDNTGAKVSMASRDSILAAQYESAVKDAADVTEDKIRPLVVIDQNSDKVTWNADSSKVMMLSFNNEPDAYRDGTTIKLEQPVWLVTEREMQQWYREHKDDVRNWPMRFRQLLGMSKSNPATHFSVLWVSPKDLIRPAFVTSIKSDEMKTQYDENAKDENLSSEMRVWFQNWFDETRARSFGKKGFPWTRLGYTYDWASKEKNKYGLTEFLTLPGAEVDVQFSKNTKSFVKWMEDRK